MPGRFEKPPLVYVTAMVRTTPRPPLDENQWRDLQQALLRQGLKQPRRSSGREFSLSDLGQAIESEDGGSLKSAAKELVRWGFFDKNDFQSLVIGRDFFEFRVADYGKYPKFKDRFLNLLEAVQTVDILAMLDVQEVILTYCDAIIPAYGTPLKNYFNADQSVLPLDFISKHRGSDLWQAGQVQVTRVVELNQKISIQLEQVPYDSERGIGKWLTNNVTEPDSELAMPLKIRPEWKGKLFDVHYGLLSTQASMLLKETLNDLDVGKFMDSLHKLTRETFDEIIDRSTCDRDWNFLPE